MALVARHILLHARKIGGGGAGPVPVGAIAMWSGLLANIPANWSLCDGAGGTPNLVARFIRGAPAATEPGTTGGLDSHTHASMTAAGSHTHTAQNQAHDHTVNIAGGHTHSIAGAASGPGAATTVWSNLAGGHQHTVSSSSHSHTMDTTVNHTHVISSDDGRPPYYEVAFIRAGVGAQVAANLIIIWTGTLVTIPAGWSLCDAGGGRPDLRAIFVRGVNTNVTNPGTTGGATTHNHTEAAYVHSHTMDNAGNHNHTFSADAWLHAHTISAVAGATYAVRPNSSAGGTHTHAASNALGSHDHNAMGNDGGHAHVVNPASSLPAYYDVAYIINDGGAVIIPTNGVLVWTGLLANIPGGYSQHAGLRNNFPRGSAAGVDPGGTGGSDTHTHTDQNAGAHTDHAMANTGAHQHANTDSIGSHTHSTVEEDIQTGAGSSYQTTHVADGAHSHAYNNENNHTHALTDPGNHVHNPWSTDDGRPGYYEVIFIQKA